nr:CnrY/NccY family anti-sigma factor [uncultured Cupriavidus sp.]
MTNVDEWLAEASKVTREASQAVDVGAIRDRIAQEPAQTVIVSRHDIWRTLCCAALAALFAFTVIDRIGTGLLSKASPTWVATPPAASPFGLLIGK